MRFIFTLAAMWLALSAATKAQDYNAGLEAYRAGDYETALAEWRPLAEQGNADAQFGLGLMYRNGKGIPQNDADAMVWLSFPTSRLASSFKYLCSKTPFNTHQTL